MKTAEAATDQMHERAETRSPRNVCVWLLVTFLGAGLLAFLAGTATPRVRLLVLFPLAMGALVAYCALALRESLNLGLRGWMLGWIILLAAGVPAGSTVHAWQLWKSGMREDRTGFMQQIDRMMASSTDQQSAQAERQKMDDMFEEHASFPAFLSYRLIAFSEQLGRNEVWAPPLPELLFAFELVVSTIAALFLCLRTWRSPRGSQDLEETAS